MVVTTVIISFQSLLSARESYYRAKGGQWEEAVTVVNAASKVIQCHI